MISIYEVEGVRAFVLDFYNAAWKTTTETRRVFEHIGYELTEAARNVVPLLQNLTNTETLYAGPIARAGCGLFRPPTIKVLEALCSAHGVTFKAFGMGLRRAENPLRRPAVVYWNTLRRNSDLDLSASPILLYEMGEATGSTIEGAMNELRRLKARSHNVVVLMGAACLDQTKSRLEAVAPGVNVVAGSRWRYEEAPGPTQYYLTSIWNHGWQPVTPRDWGRCVAGMVDRAAVDAFIDWIQETLPMSPSDRHMLRQRWSGQIQEKSVS
jgi:hypothetical protein